MIKRPFIILFLSLLSFSGYSAGIKCTLGHSYDFSSEKEYHFFKKIDKDHTVFRLNHLPESLKGILIEVWASGPKVTTIKYIDEENEIFNISGGTTPNSNDGPPIFLVIAYPRGGKRLTIQLECEIKDHI